MRPRDTLLAKCMWPVRTPKSRVRASDEEWEKILKAAVAHMEGGDRHLPYLGQLCMLEVEPRQGLIVDSEDLTSCFNLFTLPPQWAGMMTFSKQVSSEVFGGPQERNPEWRR